MARVNGKNEYKHCKYNTGVECETHTYCVVCGFNPEEQARRIAEITGKHDNAAEAEKGDVVDG